jgi:hypothetical protein
MHASAFAGDVERVGEVQTRGAGLEGDGGDGEGHPPRQGRVCGRGRNVGDGGGGGGRVVARRQNRSDHDEGEHECPVSGWDQITELADGRERVREYLDFTPLSAGTGAWSWTAGPSAHEIWSWNLGGGVHSVGCGTPTIPCQLLSRNYRIGPQRVTSLKPFRARSARCTSPVVRAPLTPLRRRAARGSGSYTPTGPARGWRSTPRVRGSSRPRRRCWVWASRAR